MTGRIILPALFIVSLLPNWSCQTVKQGVNTLIPISEDVTLGKQVAKEIAGNTKDYPLLPEQGNEEVYTYIRGISKKILRTGKVEHRGDFPWEVKIIKDDKTLNAFCTPGGYIYVYTGLIKFLDSEDQLAGVMGHEIAHAANRHSTLQLISMYGLTYVTDFLISLDKNANNKQMEQTAAQLANSIIGLKFSRDHETEADSYSVQYLCGTDYNAAGCAGFFEKIKGQPTPPQFLSTHPNPENRIQNIKTQAAGCRGKETKKDQYQRIKSLLK